MKSVSEEEGNSGAGEPETEAGPHKKQLDRQLGVQVWERCMPSEPPPGGGKQWKAALLLEMFCLAS